MRRLLWWLAPIIAPITMGRTIEAMANVWNGAQGDLPAFRF